MCRYAKKHEDGKTYCHAHVPDPYPISDDFVRTEESGFYDLGKRLEKKCRYGAHWLCLDFWFKMPAELLLLFSLIITLSYKPQVWLFGGSFYEQVFTYILSFIIYFIFLFFFLKGINYLRSMQSKE